MRETDNQESEGYVLVSKSNLLALKCAIEEYVRVDDAIKKDLEKLRSIKGQEG